MIECKNCKDRFLGCQDSCKKAQEYKSDLAKKKKQKHIANQTYIAYRRKWGEDVKQIFIGRNGKTEKLLDTVFNNGNDNNIILFKNEESARHAMRQFVKKYNNRVITTDYQNLIICHKKYRVTHFKVFGDKLPTSGVFYKIYIDRIEEFIKFQLKGELSCMSGGTFDSTKMFNETYYKIVDLDKSDKNK